MLPEWDYCIRSDTYKYFHPDTVLQDVNLVREKAYEIPKRIVKETYFDLIPPLRRYRQYEGGRSNKYRFPLQATQLFMHYEHLNNEYQYGHGRGWGCYL